MAEARLPLLRGRISSVSTYENPRIIAVRPAPGAMLAPEQLDDTGTDARLIGVVAETGTVLLDVASPRLDHLPNGSSNGL